MGDLEKALGSAEDLLASMVSDRKQIRLAVLTMLHSASTALAGSWDFAAMAIVNRAMAELAALQAQGAGEEGKP